MGVTAFLSRWVCLDVASNLRRIGEEADRAAGAGADLCVFPEAFLHGYTRRVDPDGVRARFAEVSCRHPRIAFVFGSFTEERRNRATVWRGGEELARYDKVHLFEPSDERRLWDPGDRYVAVDLGAIRLGLLTCNDVRFPEQARALRLQAGCTVLVVPAWWPWRRDDVWAALLRARAIENGCFVLGCALAASEDPAEPFAGAGNHVFDPLGAPVPTADDRTYRLDLDRAAEVLVDPVRAHVEVTRVDVARPPAPPPSAPGR